MNKLSSRHELRRAVAALLEQPIEDIELVLRSLSATERERLQPLVEEAASLNADMAAKLPHDPRDTDQDGGRAGKRRDLAAAALQKLPPALASRLFACLDDDMRKAMHTQRRMPDQGGANRYDDTHGLTGHTRATWLDACIEYAAGLESVTRPSVVRSRGITPGYLTHRLRQVMRKWIARRT